MDLTENIPLFFLGISSLLPLINPVGTALIINPYFTGKSNTDRRKDALIICVSCFVLGVATLLGGSWALKAMGISIPTTQMAGGILIARMGLEFLSDNRHKEPSGPMKATEDSLFYPLAFPLTLGPGGISALITLSAHAHSDSTELLAMRMATLTAALFVVLVATYVCFAYSEVIIRRIGNSGSLVLNRLMAFLVFCVGIQMFVTGFGKSFPRFII